jgi:pimeloyl-ACP methyl ester carboxylesterase
MVAAYLHGFASSPESSKATYFAGRFAEKGTTLVCPDFNQPAFATLTVSRMLQQLETAISRLPPGEVVLIGSSLGGFVAIEAAARQRESAPHRISRLVLLAPAVELEWDRWSELGPGGVEAWRATGRVDVFHYAQDRPDQLNFSFYEDAQSYRPAGRRLNLPMVIFQGRHDESVSPAIVERFAGRQPAATLHMLDDTHQLKNSLDFMWRETERFIYGSS